MIRLEIVQDSWCSKPPLGTKQDLTTTALATERQETALKLPLAMEQLSHQEVSPNMFLEMKQAFEGRESRNFCKLSNPSPCFILPQASSCPPDSPTTQKTSTAVSLCSRPGPGWGKQTSLCKIHHTEAQPACWTGCHLSNCKMHPVPNTFTAGPLLMHQTYKNSHRRDHHLFCNYQVPAALSALAYLLPVVSLLRRYHRIPR